MLILFFTIFFLILSWRRLDLAVMFLIIALPSYLIRFNVFGIPTTLLEIMILSAFFTWFIKNFNLVKNNFLNNFKKQNNKIKIKYPFDWEIILLLLISFISVSVAYYSSSSLGAWKAYFFEPILFFILILHIFNNKNGKEKILLSLVTSTLLISLVAIFQKITGLLIFNEFWATPETRRIVSFFGYPNAVGLYLGPLVLVIIGWLSDVVKNFQFSISNFQTISNSKIFKQFFKILFIGTTIILSVLAIYFARSEGAILGIIVGLVFFGLLANKKIITFLLIILFSCGIYIYSPARNLFINKITLSDLSGQIRQQQWKETSKMLKDNRIISGAGLANYKKTILPYHQEGIFFNSDNDPDFHHKTVFNEAYKKSHWQPTEIYLYPHNIFLNFWSELGLTGLLLFIWIIGKYFYLGIRNQKSEIRNKYLNIGLICAMIVIVIHGLVDVPYFKNDLAILFWLLIAMISLMGLSPNTLSSRKF